jgi:hypothetical protein
MNRVVSAKYGLPLPATYHHRFVSPFRIILGEASDYGNGYEDGEAVNRKEAPTPPVVKGPLAGATCPDGCTRVRFNPDCAVCNDPVPPVISGWKSYVVGSNEWASKEKTRGNQDMGSVAGRELREIAESLMEIEPSEMIEEFPRPLTNALTNDVSKRKLEGKAESGNGGDEKTRDQNRFKVEDSLFLDTVFGSSPLSSRVSPSMPIGNTVRQGAAQAFSSQPDVSQNANESSLTPKSRRKAHHVEQDSSSSHPYPTSLVASVPDNRPNDTTRTLLIAPPTQLKQKGKKDKDKAVETKISSDDERLVLMFVDRQQTENGRRAEDLMELEPGEIVQASESSPLTKAPLGKLSATGRGTRENGRRVVSTPGETCNASLPLPTSSSTSTALGNTAQRTRDFRGAAQGASSQFDDVTQNGNNAPLIKLARSTRKAQQVAHNPPLNAHQPSVAGSVSDNQFKGTAQAVSTSPSSTPKRKGGKGKEKAVEIKVESSDNEPLALSAKHVRPPKKARFEERSLGTGEKKGDGTMSVACSSKTKTKNVVLPPTPSLEGSLVSSQVEQGVSSSASTAGVKSKKTRRTLKAAGRTSRPLLNRQLLPEVSGQSQQQVGPFVNGTIPVASSKTMMEDIKPAFYGVQVPAPSVDGNLTPDQAVQSVPPPSFSLSCIESTKHRVLTQTAEPPPQVLGQGQQTTKSSNISVSDASQIHQPPPKRRGRPRRDTNPPPPPLKTETDLLSISSASTMTSTKRKPRLKPVKSATTLTIPVKRSTNGVPTPIPDELQALIDAYLNSNPVGIFAAGKHMRGFWGLDSAQKKEIGYGFMGFYRVLRVWESVVGGDGSDPVPCNGIIKARVQWKFRMKWEPGGEDWQTVEREKLESPWWNSSLKAQGLSVMPQPEMEDSDEESTEAYRNARRLNPIFAQRHCFFGQRFFSVLPLHLLAPVETEMPDSSLQRGWYCQDCGKLNFRYYMRHRRCGSSYCKVCFIYLTNRVRIDGFQNRINPRLKGMLLNLRQCATLKITCP